MENQTATPIRRRKPKKKSVGKIIACVIRRFLLVFFTLIFMVLIGLILVCNLIFNGPSPNARDRLTMSMRESSGMKLSLIHISEPTRP